MQRDRTAIPRQVSSAVRLADSSIKLLGRLVAGENKALVLCGILVPELSGLAVERTRAVSQLAPHPHPLPSHKR
jgi:hypothetical protein